MHSLGIKFCNFPCYFCKSVKKKQSTHCPYQLLLGTGNIFYYLKGRNLCVKKFSRIEPSKIACLAEEIFANRAFYMYFAEEIFFCENFLTQKFLPLRYVKCFVDFHQSTITYILGHKNIGFHVNSSNP